ncbi:MULTISPECIES: hypothetical protein [Ehrlichia]|uniref:Uncharacterized protein n=1 Tax=Ehrlichia cf. muris str. EmCRT TaxID=1359167 RepID=A0A0F3N6U5_9RICK|nr:MULTISPECIES: hypothetical protein [Ehrlichia]KJV63427.1 hypothetical protein EMUCRT_0881 [Ehrlichia cf. muris str. EmCRT]OUC04579.1 hypothetical protein DB91_01950 [Ehrlichia sp. Wisconsin_h]
MEKDTRYPTSKDQVSSNTGTLNTNTLGDAAILLILLSLAALVFAMANLSNRMSSSLKNPYFIVAMCAVAILIVSSAIALGTSCVSKPREQAPGYIKFNYGNQRSTLSLTLIIMSATSLIAAAAFIGTLSQKNMLSAFLNFNDPLCIGMYASLALLALSLLTYTLKSLIAPDSTKHIIVLGNQDLVNKAKEFHTVPSFVLGKLNLDCSAVSSLQIVDCEWSRILA